MNKLFSRILLGSLALSTIVGCSSEEDTVVMAPVPQVSSQFTPDSQWSTSIGNGVGHYFSKLKPEFAYEKVFVASRDGEVKALDPASGETLWSNNVSGDTSARLSGGLNASYGKVFIGSENGELIALSAESGELVWRKDVLGEVLARPATDNSMVIINTSRGVLVALDADTGDEAWSISTEVPNLTLRGDSAPSTASGGVFWGTANGRLAAAVVERGQLIWQQPVGTPKGATEIDRIVDVDSSPIILGTMLYTVGVNGQLIAIDLRSGGPSWKRNYSSALDMSSDGSRLYLVTDNDFVVAVDARSGTELWKNKMLENRLLTSPAIIGDYIVVGDAEGYMHWMDKDSGEFIAQQLVNDSGFAVAPIELDDGYLITTRNGRVEKLTVN